MSAINYAEIRGFNYQPSWGSTGFDIWRRFDRDVMVLELDRGKRYFPAINALRLWLSYDAWIACPKCVEADFDAALELAAQRDLVTMPVLFNRWHSGLPDYGGIYVDHFVPALHRGGSETWYRPYLDAIVGQHAEDPRVFSWDLCNEPYTYAVPASEVPEIAAVETQWLSGVYTHCKALVQTQTTWARKRYNGVYENTDISPRTYGRRTGQSSSRLAQQGCRLATAVPDHCGQCAQGASAGYRAGRGV